ncbi:hypothetical protein [Deefgea piscis]|nr:hypothetical protein [Deefgea piscis]
MTTLRASCLASGQNPRKRGWQTKRQQTLDTAHGAQIKSVSG